jgi:hypothetical protein
VLEVIFVIWEFAEDLHDFRRGFIHPPDKPSVLLLVFGLFGATLVAVGVAGEFREEAKIESAETQIRAANDELYLLLSKEAGDAAKSAKTAHDEADAVGKETRAIEERLGVASARLTALEARIAWRTVSDKQKKKLSDELQAFKGEKVAVIWTISDPEQDAFGRQLVEALKGSELDASTPSIAFQSVPPPEEYGITGMVIEGESADDAFMEGLAKALVLASLAKQPVPMLRFHTASGTATIRIMPKSQRPAGK